VSIRNQLNAVQKSMFDGLSVLMRLNNSNRRVSANMHHAFKMKSTSNILDIVDRKDRLANLRAQDDSIHFAPHSEYDNGGRIRRRLSFPSLEVNEWRVATMKQDVLY
jgi:hypothetical protein